MTFANVGTLGVAPGARDQVVAILTRSNPEMEQAGCLLYEVGTSEEHPDTVFVMELWSSAEAHRKSLELPSVRALIEEAMPLLSGEMDGDQFQVLGSPLRPSH
ncbi:putative quinol monooxygenase [Nesterenkonia sp. Act20]|uniref:putative quinol monooxygenase n=1 Tax=Nesterenkonia sp. Act20 TaxID=1483432 RepID=UPI001C43D56F|nr:antibiotic biosynthesis monooxygenase [Nesterenkonia sp. Act20]